MPFVRRPTFSNSISAATIIVVAAVALTSSSTMRPALSFVAPSPLLIPTKRIAAARPIAQFDGVVPPASSTSALYMSTASSSAANTLSLKLEKPLGLILEESEDGEGGVVVTQINEGGSAYVSPHKDALVNSKIVTVMGKEVKSSSFDEVMDAIINAPSPVDVEFATTASLGASASELAEEDEATPAAPTYEVGTVVTIRVQQPETNKADILLEAKVGDNLRKTLLANNDIELYRGLKKKLGNCGGGGQCGYCALELVDDGEGVWGERSEYEAKKIGKNGSEMCRLACMNNIVGPATVRTL